MGARTLEARLTARLVALAGAMLVAVGISAVVVTERALDASDTDAARAHATSAREALERERVEGDSPQEARREVTADAEGQGVRLSIRQDGAIVGAPIPAGIAPGDCAVVVDDRETPWRTCAAGEIPGTLVVAGVPMAAHRAAVQTLTRGMLTVVAIALLGMWLAVRRSLRAPLAELRSLVRWTKNIAEAEPARAPPRTETWEIVQLEAAFDALVRRLLEALARERSSSAHIAHELRTPLTAIVTELAILHPTDEATDAAIARVLGDVARLSDVIDAILVLSAGARRGGSDDAVVNVADLARELAPAGASVEAPDEALVETDERLVRLALRNLIENARKYAAGARLVKVTRDGAFARVSVVDDGPGLDLAARERMFDRYWRGSADHPGRGLGLALVRAVAERYGGRAEARSGDQGSGLEVSMTLDRLVCWHDEAPERVP